MPCCHTPAHSAPAPPAAEHVLRGRVRRGVLGAGRGLPPPPDLCGGAVPVLHARHQQVRPDRRGARRVVWAEWRLIFGHHAPGVSFVVFCHDSRSVRCCSAPAGRTIPTTGLLSQGLEILVGCISISIFFKRISPCAPSKRGIFFVAEEASVVCLCVFVCFLFTLPLPDIRFSSWAGLSNFYTGVYFCL